MIKLNERQKKSSDSTTHMRKPNRNKIYQAYKKHLRSDFLSKELFIEKYDQYGKRVLVMGINKSIEKLASSVAKIDCVTDGYNTKYYEKGNKKYIQIEINILKESKKDKIINKPNIKIYLD